MLQLWGVILVLLFFNGTIYFHELGHYLAARKRGLQIDRFSLFGIGPKIVGWRGKDGVEYCICWLPFGAYVALPQLAEMEGVEGPSGGEGRNLPPLSWTDKVVVAAAGPIFNLFLGFVLAAIVWVTGFPTSEASQSNLVGFVAETIVDESGNSVPSPAAMAGLQPGDRIVSIDGERIRNFQDLTMAVVTGSGESRDGRPAAQVVIERGGEELDLTLYPVRQEMNPRSGERIRKIGVSMGYKPVLTAVLENSPAWRAGMGVGDVILELNSTPVYSTRHFNDLVAAVPDGEPVLLLVERISGDVPEEESITLVPELVAVTKPILRIDDSAFQKGPLEIVPSFSGEVSDPANPSTEADLFLYPPVDDASATLRLLKAGDRVVAIDGKPVGSLAELHAQLVGIGTRVSVMTLERNGQSFQWPIPASASTHLVEASWSKRIGVGMDSREVVIYPNPFEQIASIFDLTLSTLGSLINPQTDIGPQHLMGAVDISRRVYILSQLDLRLVLWFAVLLNINLAILNLMPIPVLDGGHITIATLSKLRGKPLPSNLIASIQTAFVVLLFGLMFFVLYNDTQRWRGEDEIRDAWEHQSVKYLPVRFDSPTN